MVLSLLPWVLLVVPWATHAPVTTLCSAVSMVPIWALALTNGVTLSIRVTTPVLAWDFARIPLGFGEQVQLIITTCRTLIASCKTYIPEWGGEPYPKALKTAGVETGLIEVIGGNGILLYSAVWPTYVPQVKCRFLTQEGRWLSWVRRLPILGTKFMAINTLPIKHCPILWPQLRLNWEATLSRCCIESALQQMVRLAFGIVIMLASINQYWWIMTSLKKTDICLNHSVLGLWERLVVQPTTMRLPVLKLLPQTSPKVRPK